jgi:Mg2+ and Co2+ transporter CorA
MDPDLRLPRLLQELADRRVRLRLENGQLHVEHGDRLTAELCDEVTELRAELVEYLHTQGEEIVDDPEERAHGDMRTLPRTPEEAERQRADANAPGKAPDAGIRAARS